MKKTLSLVLVLAMLFSLVSIPALAEEGWVTLRVEAYDREVAGFNVEDCWQLKYAQEHFGDPNKIKLEFVSIPRWTEGDVLTIQLSGQTAPDLCMTYNGDLINLNHFFRSYTSRGLNRFQLRREDAARLVGWVRELQENQAVSRSMDRFRNYTTLLNFINTVCRVIDQSEALTDTVKTNGIMQQVLTYINSNYTQPMKIADLAKRFNISGSYLSHEFARFTKRSIYDYILYRRVMLAKEMMHTDASLNSIAYQCGFNDYSNFLRKFNQIVGVSPREFRHQLHGQNYRK